ncbi:cation:proton antiporter [Shewanella waksmanii]|uniref:cation:proton antiporter n=1 Tax=Shewanella waksmanii TaxID=213783 RepID=UPI00373638B2
MVEHLSAMLGLLGVLSLLCQWLGWKLRLPAILPLLLCGLILGPMLGVLNPDAIFGDLLFPIISLGVAVILFEGALTLNFKEIQEHGRMVINLVTFGTLITWIIISTATYWIIGFNWELSMLFGSLVVVTGPTVIVPMLRSIRPNARIANILRWEGIVIDPIGALLAVLVFEYIAVAADPTQHVLHALGYMLGAGLGIGALSGYLVGQILKRELLPHYLKNTAVLTIMLGVFVGSNIIQEESGLLTVTVMGIWLANMKGVYVDDIIEFKETLTVLLISALFILLAARLNSDALFSLGWEGLLLLAVVMFIARPVSVWLCSLGSNLANPDRWFLSWLAPRGIVAAAVSSLFAIKLERLGTPNAELIVPLVFLIIIGTVVSQSLTAGAWARFLGVASVSPQGFLIFGGSKFAREIAKVLMQRKVNVIISDNNWDNIRLARMDNIPVYFGNPTSEHAQNHMDMAGIGRLLVLSPYRQFNPLVSYHFQDYFGKDRVFGLNNNDVSSARHQLSEDYLKRLCLFGDSVSYARLASTMAKGGLIKVTNITDSFSGDDLKQRYGEGVLPLMYIQNKKVHVITNQEQPLPAGIELIYLITAEQASSSQPNSETSSDTASDASS